MAVARRRATSWRPKNFLASSRLGRNSRWNGCTVRTLQGAWRPFRKDDNHQRDTRDELGERVAMLTDASFDLAACDFRPVTRGKARHEAP